MTIECTHLSFFRINPATKRNSSEDVPVSALPRCKKKSCNGLLRPDIVWLSESIDPKIVEKTGLSNVCFFNF